MREIRFLLALFLLVAGFGDDVRGDENTSDGFQAFGAAIVPAVQTPVSSADDVTVARISLVCGRHCSVSGFDLGVIGNMADEDASGLELSAIFSSVGTEMTGLQIGSVCMAHLLTGVQLGIFNRSDQSVGFQLGLLNSTECLTGVQIGLININLDSPVPVAPLFNCYF